MQLTKIFSLISIWIMLSTSLVVVVFGESNIPYSELICLFLIAFLPGACHGLIQMEMISRYTSRNPNIWLAITIGSASLGWGIIFIILKYTSLMGFFVIVDNIPFSMLKGVFLGTFMGCVIGIGIGGTQWFYARSHLNLFRWLFATVTAWSIALAIPLALLFWFFAGMQGLRHIEF